MKLPLVKRSDGMMLNLNSVLIFTPQKDNMVVELPGNQFYIIEDFYSYFLLPGYENAADVYYKEFRGWPVE